MRETVMIRGTLCEIVECGVCGICYTVPKVMIDHHRRDGGYHHCPSGHGWGWDKKKSERERERRELERLRQDIARADDERLEALAAATEAQERARKAEAAAKKIKKRAAAGTCPCCKRTFSDMSEHMKRQHPEFVRETGANVVPIKPSKAA